MKKILLAFSVLLGVLSSAPVFAESLVVAVCGTLPLAYSPGATRLDTVDVNGVKCTNSSGGGGGGGAVTIANGADVALGSIGDTAWVSGNGTAISLLKNIATGVAGSIPAGTNVIGHVIVDSGGGGAVTIANGASVALGTTTDTAWVSGAGTTISLLKNIATGVAGSVPAGTNLIGAVNVAAAATGGCTPGKLLSSASTNGTSIKGAAGTLCKISVINTTTTLYYLKFYNVSGTPTCNTDTVVATYAVPYGSSNTGGGIVVNLGPFGEAYTTGIGMCLTGGIADNDNTSAATGVTISYSSK